MKLLEKLKSRASALKKEITALYYVYRNPRLPLLPKIIIVITVAYALSPIDLIPDFIPVLGYLDDLIILPALVTLAIKLIPADLMAEARVRAEKEPVRLKKNLLAAGIFISIWVALIALIIVSIFRVL